VRLGFKVGWAVQTAVAYFIPLAFALLLAVWINEPDTVTWDVFNYVFFAVVGLTLGVLVSRVLPASVESGRWVWAGPVGLMVVYTFMGIGSGRIDIITLWFGKGEDGWTRVIVTSPTLGCCCYSAAMEWARRRRNRPFARTELSGVTSNSSQRNP
jgi:hypothetical protein